MSLLCGDSVRVVPLKVLVVSVLGTRLRPDLWHGFIKPEVWVWRDALALAFGFGCVVMLFDIRHLEERWSCQFVQSKHVLTMNARWRERETERQKRDIERDRALDATLNWRGRESPWYIAINSQNPCHVMDIWGSRSELCFAWSSSQCSQLTELFYLFLSQAHHVADQQLLLPRGWRTKSLTCMAQGSCQQTEPRMFSKMLVLLVKLGEMNSRMFEGAKLLEVLATLPETWGGGFVPICLHIWSKDVECEDQAAVLAEDGRVVATWDSLLHEWGWLNGHNHRSLWTWLS